MAEGHVNVLLFASIEALKLKAGMTAIDGTLGGGGHAEEILRRITPGGRLIGIDKDGEAIERTKERLAAYGESFTAVRADFKDVRAVLKDLGIGKADAAVLDLGVSSFQLDDGQRGFSYNQEARLDMRMDRRDRLSAYEVVNAYPERDLAKVIMDYGEERWAKRIAAFIIAARKQKPIETTLELAGLIKAAIPKGARIDGPHPAKRTFQALRIEVNGELSGLDAAITDFSGALLSGARFSVITFHSLEDRIVKHAFRRLESPCECPPSAPVCICGKKSTARVITRKPILPDAQELKDNPRARSAKLRILEII